jgi:hypothetical protein
MNSIISGSRLVAGAMCGVVLAGCNAVEDVRTEPFVPVPTASVVLKGTIDGLGTRRPLTLQNSAAANPAATAKKFFGTAGAAVSPLDFGAVLVGSHYKLEVKPPQPFGKICTVANGEGNAGEAGAQDIAVTCRPDPAVTRYNVTVTIPAAVTALPNLTLGLETEEGTVSATATGLTTFTFPVNANTGAGSVFNSLLNVPSFQYKVTATTDTTQGGITTHNKCLLAAPVPSGRPGMNTTTVDNVVIPTAAVTVAITGCSFTAAGSIAYSTPPGGTAQPVGAMTLGLKDLSGTIVQTVSTAAAATTFTFPTPLMSNDKAIYELVVTSQPAGQFCVVSGNTASTVWSFIASTLGSSITSPTASAILLLDPAVQDWWAFAGRNVRCRAVPALANQLTGTYQMNRATPTAARPREFLTFFADGSFLYGINYTATPPGVASPFVSSNANASSGVIHGFYNYNPVAATMAFSVLTATNISPANFSITGMPGFAAGTLNATAVTKGSTTTPLGVLGTMSLTFTGNNPSPVPGVAGGATSVTKTWNMTEPESKEGEVTGTWVTADHRRMFAYNNNENFAFHAGVNGVGNLQDTCLLADDNSTQSSGLIARHAGSTFNCTPGGQFRTPDLPNWTTTGTGVFLPTVIRIPWDLNRGRMPGTASQLDNRPTSPITFSVVDNVAPAADTLTVQETLNGVPINQPVTFLRQRAN